MFLYFTVTNFRCFTNPVTLDLTKPELRTNVPRNGQSWTDVTERVAAIYGPNAAGKTTLIDAIYGLAQAIRNPGSGSIYEPHLGHPEPETSVDYELGFVDSQQVRYHYELSAKSWGISHEALYSYPKGTRRLLFTRSQATPDSELQVKAGASLTGPTAEVKRITGPKMLFLATAHKYGHSSLSAVAKTLLADTGVQHIAFRDRQDHEVLHRVVMEMVTGEQADSDLAGTLLSAADLGITGVEVHKRKIPKQIRARMKRVAAALNDGAEVPESEIPKLGEALRFKHETGGSRPLDLPLEMESSGTITWLTTAWHALDALRRGSLLLLDELDASLHPELARYIVQLFLSPDLNQRGAQLVCTTHDVSLLGNSPVSLLEPANVWFVEKDPSGTAELYSLDDFDNRPGNNSAKRYLAGRFGALPDIDESLVAQFLSTDGA